MLWFLILKHSRLEVSATENDHIALKILLIISHFERYDREALEALLKYDQTDVVDLKGWRT